jgi:hypothetical protein
MRHMISHLSVPWCHHPQVEIAYLTSAQHTQEQNQIHQIQQNQKSKSKQHTSNLKISFLIEV